MNVHVRSMLSIVDGIEIKTSLSEIEKKKEGGGGGEKRKLNACVFGIPRILFVPFQRQKNSQQTSAKISSSIKSCTPKLPLEKQQRQQIIARSRNKCMTQTSKNLGV